MTRDTFRGPFGMTRTLKRIALALVAGAMLLTAPPAATAADTTYLDRSDLSGQVIHLGTGKSMTVDLPEDIKDILVSNPAVADAVLKSDRQLFLIGVTAGEANVVLFGEGGRQLGEIELVVSRDTAGLDAMIRTVAPRSDVKVQTIGEMLILSGTVPTAEVGQRVADMAGKFIGAEEKVVNSLTIGGSDQVNLRVVIAELQRTVARQLGVNFGGTTELGGIDFRPLQTTFADTALQSTLGIRGSDFSARIRALQEDGVMRTLAEPNLTAVSGEDANFLVGGEVPVLASVEDGVARYTYKPYGVALSFTPVVLAPGRIVLRIKTEISEIDPTNGTEVFVAFKTRRAETTVEMPSGGAIAIGGLLQDNQRRTHYGTPALLEIPILGALFKSADYQRQQTELVIFVTPYTVEPVPTAALTRPDKNFTFSRDAQNIFLGQVNKIYRAPGAQPTGGYAGHVGFAYE